MKMPICDSCLKGGPLCQKCGKKLKEGKISELDVEVSRALYELAREYRELEGIELERALRERGLTALVVRGSTRIADEKDEIIRKLGERLNTRVRLAESGEEIRKLAQDILAPARVNGVNILFKKGGGEEYRVRVKRTDLMLLPSGIDTLQKIMGEVTSKDIKFVFE